MAEVDLARVLAAAMSERMPSGEPRFSRESVRDVLALLLLTQPSKLRTLPRGSLALLGEFSVAIRAPLAEPGTLQSRLDAYFSQHPPNPELLARVRVALAR